MEKKKTGLKGLFKRFDSLGQTRQAPGEAKESAKKKKAGGTKAKKGTF